MSKSKSHKSEFGVMAFQYEPLQKVVLAQLKKFGATQEIENYHKLSTARKMYILDGMHQRFYSGK